MDLKLSSDPGSQLSPVINDFDGYNQQSLIRYKKGVLFCGGKKDEAMSKSCFYHDFGSNNVTEMADLEMPFECCLTLTINFEAPDGNSYYVMAGRIAT